MKKLRLISTVVALLCAASLQTVMAATQPHFVSKETQQATTPAQVLQLLKAGNTRYINHQSIQYNQRDLSAKAAKHGQSPYAFVLACIDSRSTPNVIFNQPVGSLFVSRIAGNPVTPYVLGGMEFATKFVNTHLVVIMGHTHCGAIAGACHGLTHPKNLGHLLSLLQPAVKQVQAKSDKPLDCDNSQTINAIAKQNVLDQMHNTLSHSPVLAAKVKAGTVKIVGAMQDIETGKVSFFN